MSAGIAGALLLGAALLIAGAELLVRGASRLAMAAGISPLVVGLTVVAFGTSAPELFVTAGSAFAGNANIGLGNVIGSNICNVLLILGLSAAISPLVVAQQLVRVEVPLMIGTSALVMLLGVDGVIGRWDGLLLFSGIIVYTVFIIRQSRRESRAVQAEYEQAFGAKPGSLWVNLGLVVAGFAMLTAGSRSLVDAAVSLATALGVSDLVIGLTIVAVGTSLPEVATSVLASIRGERDIAVGNVVGSNLFNVLTVLGIASLVAPAGIPVPTGALYFDIPVMIAVSLATLPIFFTGYEIARWEGFLFLGYYAAYTLYLVLDATAHDALPAFRAAMGLFVLPLTTITLAVLAIRAVRHARRAVH